VKISMPPTPKLEPPCRPSPRPRPADNRPLAPIFKALGDATRLEIVTLLAESDEPLCACDIEAHFDLAQATISHHLNTLRKVGALSSKRRGTWVFYSLDPGLAERLRAFVGALDHRG
jgi:ArsR family transcriptional regulator, arsenate/arsenite/antimonite-responsive transcriptional repressor